MHLIARLVLLANPPPAATFDVLLHRPIFSFFDAFSLSPIIGHLKFARLGMHSR